METRRSYIDIGLICISLFLFTWSASTLFQDFYLGPNISDKDLIQLGQISDKQNDVSRRVEEDVIWHEIHSEQPVYLGDTLFTGDRSSATILTYDNSKIRLGPNTLVSLSQIDNILSLQLAYGSFSGSLNNRVRISLRKNGRQQYLEGQGGEVSVKHVGNQTDVAVSSGQVFLKKGKQQIALRANQLTEFGSDFQIKGTRNINIFSLTPQTGQNVIVNRQGLARFKWDPLKEGSIYAYKVEISPDPFFRQVYARKYTRNPTLRMNIPDQALGANYWRVQAFDNKKQLIGLSHPQLVRISKEKKPLLIWPRPRQLVRFADPREDDLRLRWRHPKNANTTYLLEISKDKTFQKIYFKQKTAKLHADFKPDSLGPYYWRVSAISNQSALNLTSAARSFMVKIHKRPGPTITQPIQVQRLTEQFVAKIENQMTSEISLPRPFKLNWEQRQDSQFELELSQTSDFKRSRSVNLATNQYKIDHLFVGPLFWRVRSKGSAKSSQWSRVGRLAVKLPSPKADKIMKKSRRRIVQTSQISWKALPLAPKYELLTSSNADFSSSRRETILSYQIDQVDRVDSVYWKVRALTSAGVPSSPFSPTYFYDGQRKVASAPAVPLETPPPQPQVNIKDRSFDLEKVKPLPVPELIEPSHKKTIDYIPYIDFYIFFSWKPLKRAKTYEFQIARDKGFHKIILKTKTTRPKILLKMDTANPKGKHYWRVRSLGFGHRSPWSKVHIFDANEVIK